VEAVRRRDFLGTTAAAAAYQSPPAANGVRCWVKRLDLRHTWTTVMSSSEFRETFFVSWTHDGVTGVGEGAPIVRYKESAQSAAETLQPLLPWLSAQQPMQFEKILAQLSRRVEGHYATKAAVDIALHDWLGKKLGIPLYQHFGLDPNDTPLTTFSIGIDKPEVIRQKVREAEQYPVLKVKVGLDNDEEVIEAVRSVTKKPLRVDANEGFKSKEQAVERINWLEKLGVEFIEQPLPASNLEDMNWIRKRVHMPVIADEACLSAADIPKIATCFDGINVKVDKAGGLLEAWRMINMARALGMKTMLGCMVSSSCSVTAAAHLSPLVDYADLDGNLLIKNDPYAGVTVVNGKLILPSRPGLGLTNSAV
jgi:L-alanine-DL-glutamate epimerase-like enolase superfamily enzyme